MGLSLTIMDRYTKKVIAWDLGKRMTVELVQRTLNKAIKSQDYPEAVILHCYDLTFYSATTIISYSRI